MNTRTLPRLNDLLRGALAPFLAALAGCDVSPTAPADPVMDLETTVTFTRVEVLKDGDGIEGKGEFWFFRTVNGSGAGWGGTLSSGDTQPLNKTVTRRQRGYTGTGDELAITFEATEYDADITGKTYADSDMDHRSATARYTMSPDLQDRNYITLGNDKCRVRLHYTVSSLLVPAS